jgi:predicted HTH transcriptional regulator
LNMETLNITEAGEGRRLEFKSGLPTNSDLVRTVVAFANDAGGEIYIGINNDRKVVGLPEEQLPQIEEKISNMVYDRCYPSILPEISFLSLEDKHIIRIRIYRGSMPPYYLKSEGKLKGTYIRVGSNNRQADEHIIAELERNRRNISFDGEVVLDKVAHELDIHSFKNLYKEKTEEILDMPVLRKLELIKKEQDKEYPTNALVLLSDDKLRYSMFPNAKIECARFKGTETKEFIDHKSITDHIGIQAEEAYSFILRHINKGATVEGVYTVSRWEYPILAIREIIRNAVVHRQYSLTGKDIKVAVYDDMVEITSPGLLPPSIDYAAMESRQSDARNKVIAPVFKRLGIIDQWGNGLKLVAEEMKEYPDIKLQWKEIGLSFQVQFIKKNYTPLSEEYQVTGSDSGNAGGGGGNIGGDSGNVGGDGGNVGGDGANIGGDGGNTGGDGGDTGGDGGNTGGDGGNVGGDGGNVGGDGGNVGGNGGNAGGDGGNIGGDGGNLNAKERIIALITLDHKISVQTIARNTGISKRNCERAIAELKRTGVISRSGSTRSGHWIVKSKE